LLVVYQELADGDHALGNVLNEATSAVLDWLRVKAFLSS
jgi:hypothetical protein